jgi:hypothetical protein
MTGKFAEVPKPFAGNIYDSKSSGSQHANKLSSQSMLELRLRCQVCLATPANPRILKVAAARELLAAIFDRPVTASSHNRKTSCKLMHGTFFWPIANRQYAA